MVQSIKSLGRDQFSEARIVDFRNAFTEEERRQVLRDSSFVTFWIYKLIRKICSEDSDG